MKKCYLLLVIILAMQCVAGQSYSKEIAFIGNKISIKKLRNGEAYTADTIGTKANPVYLTTFINSKFELKYKIKKILHGQYQYDSITFIAYDHHDIPKFTELKNVLLFFYYQDSGYVCVSNRYIQVFETKDNRWASDYSIGWVNPFIKDAKISPKKIEFIDDISFDLNDKDSIKVIKDYTFPYYQIVDSKAIPVYGYYVDELLNLLSGKIPYKINGERRFMFFD